MVDFYTVQAALATAAGAVTGLRTYPTMPDAINPPVFAPAEVDIDYHQAFGGLIQLQLTCMLFVSRGDTAAGRKLLLSYTPQSGAASIMAAIEADKTLGGACGTLIVDRARGVGALYAVAGVEYLGARFDVRVWVP